MTSFRLAATENYGMFGARKFFIGAMCAIVCATANLCASNAAAQTIDLSLNVLYSSPSDVNSGGTWLLVAKSSNFGIAGLTTRVTGISSPTDLAPRATVNGSATAGFNADPVAFIPATQTTPSYFELDFGQAQLDLNGGAEQSAFYGVGQLANGSPNFAAKPVGSNFEGPLFTTLTSPQHIPWATGDVFGSPAWATGALLASGTFAANATPASVSGSAGDVFTSLGTSTAFGSIAATLSVSTIVRTNFVPGSADYNHNGVVDMADYVLWRNTLGQSVTAGTGADGSLNGIIDQADYNLWRSHFGSASGAGSGSLSSTSVPEPMSGLLLVIGAMLLFGFERTHRARYQVAYAVIPASATAFPGSGREASN
jgi:hypothetical protein